MELLKKTLPSPETAAEIVKACATANPSFTKQIADGIPTVKALNRLAMDFLRGKRAIEAIPLLRAALALTSESPLLWMNYGTALDQCNSPAEAADCFEYSLQLSRQQPDTWLLLGMTRKKLGDPIAAETAFRVVLEQDPKFALAWQLLGLLKQEQGDFAGAAHCLISCIKNGGTNAPVLANLGKLQYQLGRFAEADEAYKQALLLDPSNLHYRQMQRKTSFLREVLAGESMETVVANYKNSFATGESYSEKELEDFFSTAFSMLTAFARDAAAERVGKKRLELWPDDDHATKYLLKAVTGDRALDRSTPEYLVEHFDKFAEKFDEQLVGALHYDIPEKLCTALRKFTEPGQLYNILDAGCGTGLCGPLLRPFSKELIGVDLSPKMLEQAARKNVYDKLVCEEIITFLKRSPGCFDQIVATDVMIYFGDLAPFFSLAAIALRPGGLFAFSTEVWNGEEYRIQPSGRFAQSTGYIRSLAAASFEELFFTDTTVRLEALGRLPGNLFIFRRR